MMNWYGGTEPHHMAELRRLFTTFGYLVANQGAVAVIGLPDPVFGEQVAACVELAPGASADAAELQALCELC